ncbi:MAG TPA: D-2-hydroxyacid dehydrogenase [Pyrinomonadaceae bacterium]|nr:D-2-hydroxyacid dehydrogenase [Pyrinomonadaceae bacterium]
MNAQFTIWCDNDFDDTQQRERDLLLEGVGPHHLLMFDPNDATARHALRDAEIAFGTPDAPAAAASLRLRWAQLNSAGYTSFDDGEIRAALTARDVIVTNSSDVYAEPCAQHLLAMITGIARGLPVALDSQRGDHSWRRSLRPGLPLLNGQTVLILGYGAIARRLVELLHPLEMNLVAARRQIKGDEPISILTDRQIDEFLPTVDHLVNTLPANKQTDNFVNAARLARLKAGAIVYNIGRGTTLDQHALIKELNCGRLAAAYLDVTEPEPLPTDHPLWSTPNCYISPHLGGGHRTEKERQVRHFLDNLGRFVQGAPLRNRVI